MENQQEENIDALNKLVEILRDGNQGYKHAADRIENDEFKTILYRLSQQRALFQAEIMDEIRHLGGNPENESTVMGTIHRKWLDFKAGLSDNDTESILEACQTGEKAAIDTYEEVLKKDLPDYLKEKVNSQFHLVKGAYQQLQEFKAHPGE